MNKPILCLDFDGVCHSYTSGWKGADVIPDPPVKNLFEFILKAQEIFEVNIFSSRSNQYGGIESMTKWFWLHCPPEPEMSNLVALLKFPKEKPPAFVGIDDRVITFTGVFPNINDLINFKPWNKRSEI